jgi:hypothetical protein
MPMRYVLAVVLILAAFATTTVSRTSSPTQTGAPMHAKGTFDVKLTPQTDSLDPTLGRMTIEKQIHGDLEAKSVGQMLTVATDVKGSGTYVAVERVTGKLNGRSGSFAMHHTGIMIQGTPQLEIKIVPDSGTGELAGISGTFTLTITNGQHLYDLEYSLRQ